MNPCKLHILVCGDEELVELARNATLMPRFEYCINVCDDLAQAPVEEADVVLTQLPVNGGLKQLRTRCGERKVLLVCGTMEEIDTLTEIELYAVDEYLGKPLHPRLAGLRLSRVLEEVKLRRTWTPPSEVGSGAEMDWEGLLWSIPFAAMLLDNDDVVAECNEKFLRNFDLKREQVVGKKSGEWEQNVPLLTQYINEEGCHEFVVRQPSLDGEIVLERNEELVYDRFHNERGKIRVYQDVTQARALQQEIQYNLNNDVLTGLYNRSHFYQYLAVHRKNLPLSLLYVDLEHFKEVNDTFGHEAGDEALVRTAGILRASFPGELIARLGGDEFVVAVLGPCGRERLETMAQALLEQLQENFDVCRELKALSASVGIARSEGGEINIDDLLRQSDTALRQARRAGKARYQMYHINM